MMTELDKEREERNYFQLERDKINSFWEITKRQCVSDLACVTRPNHNSHVSFSNQA